MGILGPKSAITEIYQSPHGITITALNWEREDFAVHCGYVPQSLALLGETVAMNVAHAQMLPVGDHAVQILDDPNHLGHVMEDILIQLRLVSC